MAEAARSSLDEARPAAGCRRGPAANLRLLVAKLVVVSSCFVVRRSRRIGTAASLGFSGSGDSTTAALREVEAEAADGAKEQPGARARGYGFYSAEAEASVLRTHAEGGDARQPGGRWALLGPTNSERRRSGLDRADRVG
ncbi:unnamed protein product [Urochloa humidicola]